MKRQNPFLTILGLLFTLIFVVGLLFSLALTGGKAFSPGRLSAKGQPGVRLAGYESHAAFEDECSRCHKPLESNQSVLCLECHTNEAAQIKAGGATHGRINQPGDCKRCHSDHHGTAFDPTNAAFEKFDHSITDFSLVWHQFDYQVKAMECGDCHLLEPGMKPLISRCAECHLSNDAEYMTAHIRDFGEVCTTCHDGRDRMPGFDHQQTRFPLEGAHEQLRCNLCHNLQSHDQIEIAMDQNLSGFFTNTPGECAGCHSEPDLHQANFASDCALCHTPTSWSPVLLDGELFAHAANTRFTLVKHQRDFAGRSITCNACHLEDLKTFAIERCMECHSQTPPQFTFMNEHTGQYGATCLNCHDGFDRMSNFDHNAVFQLDGRHAGLDCENCHSNQYYAVVPRECQDCHLEPALHQGFFGLKCHYCHDSQAWAPAPLRIHGFPIEHGDVIEVDCQICHPTRYTEYTCYSCHEHEETSTTNVHLNAGIELVEISNCIQCHPTGDLSQE